MIYPSDEVDIDPSGGYDLVIDPTFSIEEAAPRLFSHSTKWNDMFQVATEMPTSTPQERFVRAKQIYRIYENFVQTATGTGKIIIEELNTPPARKTISKIHLGIAGGEKFFHEGIFFKLATDSHKMYGGDCWSIKAAGHEIKAFNEIMQCSEKNGSKLRFPMMTTIDYFGHRLFAVAFLPISSSTILYGSPNGGRLIYNNSTELNSMIEDLASHLFLKLHIAGEGISERPTSLFLPTDAEGHLGRDGRYYLVDVPRLFPGEREFVTTLALHLPSDSKVASQWININRSCFADQITSHLHRTWIETKFPHLLLIVYSSSSAFTKKTKRNYRAEKIIGSPIYGDCIILRGEITPAKGEPFYFMLRPELLREFRIPLSSDTWTKFGLHSSNLHEEEVSTLRNHLLHTKIPAFVNWLMQNSDQVISSLHLPYLLHREGINLRYIGLIYTLLPASSPRLKYSIVGFQMLERVLNDLLAAKLRQRTFDSFSGLQDAIVHFFNLILGNDQESDDFWSNHVPTQLQLKYGPFGFKYDPTQDLNLKASLGHLILFQELQCVTGVMFRPAVTIRFTHKNKHLPYIPLEASDIVEVKPKIKKWRWSVMPFIREQAEAMARANLQIYQDHPECADPNYPVVCEHLRNKQLKMEMNATEANQLLFRIEAQQTHIAFTSDVFGRSSIETIACIFRVAAKLNSIGANQLAIARAEEGAKLFIDMGPVNGEICLSCLYITGCILETAGRLDSAEVTFKILVNHVEELFDSNQDDQSASPIEFELHRRLLHFATEQRDQTAIRYHKLKLKRLQKSFPRMKLETGLGQSHSVELIMSFLSFENLTDTTLDCTNVWKDFLACRLNSENGLTPPVKKRLKY